MKHLQTLMGQPSPDGLSDILRTQHRLVEEMLFRTIELTALVDSGQHRFIGRALDDLERAERELGQTELVRAAITEAIVGAPPGTEPTLPELLSTIDGDTATAIEETAARIRSSLQRIEAVRHDAVSAATQRVSRARRALDAATSDAGLYNRA